MTRHPEQAVGAVKDLPASVPRMGGVKPLADSSLRFAPFRMTGAASSNQPSNQELSLKELCRNRSMRRVVFMFLICCAPSIAVADDWSEWRGPDRADKSRETNLLKQWPTDGPQRVWLYQDAGQGYSGFSIVQNQLFTMGTRDGQTILLSLNVTTGEELWSLGMGESLDNDWGNGPRSTPTVRNGLVYAISGEGVLVCAQAQDGDLLWQRHMEEFAGKRPKWGYSESVLVDDGQVVCTPGGNVGMVVALAADSGKLIWQTKSLAGQPHYSSFIKVEHEGKPQYVQLAKTAVFGLDPANGNVLWQSDWNGRIAVVPTPIYHDGQVYITSGYGVGCKLLALTDGEPH